MHNRRLISTLILGFFDIVIFYLTLAISLIIRLQDLNSQIWNVHLWPFSWLLGIWLIINYGMNEYDASVGNRSTFDQSTQSLKLLVLHIFSGIALFYLIPTTNISPKTILIIVAVIFSGLHFLSQTKIRKIIRRANFATTNTAIVGNNPLVPTIISAISLPLWGMKVVAWFSDEPITDNQGVKTFPLNELPYYKEPIDTLIVVDNKSENITNALYKSLTKPRRVLKLLDVYEQIYQHVPPQNISANWVIDSLAKGKRNGYVFIKRICDIILSTIFLILSLPLIPFIAVIIKLTSQGPVFFTQTRSGYLGKEFLAIKFRSWFVGHENDESVLAEENDPRITHFGKILRSIRFDEIPQLLNILSGDMSFVGPRPERPELVKKYVEEQPLYAQRLLSKPGLTGWAQINQSYQQAININSKLSYDLYYLKYQSLALDLKIILKTINTILSRNG
jgi:exopolysaccharide biosynthesis polyprenyl glycosylphosphotransferase